MGRRKGRIEKLRGGLTSLRFPSIISIFHSHTTTLASPSGVGAIDIVTNQLDSRAFLVLDFCFSLWSALSGMRTDDFARPS